MLKQRHQVFVTLLGVTDAAAAALACYGAWAARLVWADEPLPSNWESYFKAPLVLFAIPIVLGVMATLRMYRPMRDRSLWPEQGQVLKASIISAVMMVVALWAVGSSVLGAPGDYAGPRHAGWRLVADPTRFQLAAFAVFLPVILGLQRVAFRLGLRWIRSRGWNLRHVAVIGVGRLGQITARTLGRNSWTGIKVAYFVSHHQETRRKTCLGAPVHGGLDELESILESHPIDAVYLALPGALAGQMPDLLRRLERYALDVRIVPDVHPRYLPQSMQVSELEGMPILSYRECPLNGLGGFTKRLADIGGATLALVVFGPLMLAIAIAIRLGGPGPVIFKQKRVSLGGEVFRIYKFRTMRHEPADAPATWTMRDDPRVTRLGRLLRRTSLDELPQLLNVLRGDMSLVGPRPERPELIEQFRDDWRGYMLRQHVKAGITGWAQVNGLRGDTSLRKRLQYDLFYIRHWSLRLDVRILFMTLRTGFLNPNAH